MQKKCFGLRHKNKSLWEDFGWEEDNQGILRIGGSTPGYEFDEDGAIDENFPYDLNHIYYCLAFETDMLWVVQNRDEAEDALIKAPETSEDADNCKYPAFYQVCGGYGKDDEMGWYDIEYDDVEVVEIIVDTEKKTERDESFFVYLNIEDKNKGTFNSLGYDTHLGFEDENGEIMISNENTLFEIGENLFCPVLTLSENEDIDGNHHSEIDMSKYERTEVFIRVVEN